MDSPETHGHTPSLLHDAVPNKLTLQTPSKEVPFEQVSGMQDCTSWCRPSESHIVANAVAGNGERLVQPMPQQ